jgi:hypothetical protein
MSAHKDTQRAAGVVSPNRCAATGGWLSGSRSRVRNEADDRVRAQGCGATCLLLQGRRGLLVDHDDSAVIVGLVEQLRRGQRALTGAAAPVAIHLDSHALIALPGDGEAVDAVDEHVVAHWYLVGSHGQAEPGEASEKSAVADLHLDSGELLAQALMDPVPERDML